MANRCTHIEPGCGCVDAPMTTPPACPPSAPCPEAQPCSSYTDAECVIYTGEDILCNEQVIAEQNQPLSEILANLTALACSSPILASNILCGEDVVVTAGSTTQQALTGIVNYFCQALLDNTIALITSNQVNQITDNCTTSTTTLSFWSDLGATQLIASVPFSFTYCNGVDLERDHLKYTALISQLAGSAPTVVVLGDNTIGVIVWTRSGVGTYLGTLIGAFPVTTWVYIRSGVGNQAEAQITRINANEILIQTFGVGLSADSILTDFSLEIRVYP